MSVDPYCQWRLRLLAELTIRAWGRVEDALVGGAGPLAGDAINEALRWRQAALAGAFPEAAALVEPGACLERLERAWLAGLSALADDNELDVPRPGADGAPRTMERNAVEWILASAELAGRIRSVGAAGPEARL